MGVAAGVAEGLSSVLAERGCAVRYCIANERIAQRYRPTKLDLPLRGNLDLNLKIYFAKDHDPNRAFLGARHILGSGTGTTAVSSHRMTGGIEGDGGMIVTAERAGRTTRT